MLTFLCALNMIRQPNSYSWQNLREGFSFQLRQDGLITAIAVFGLLERWHL
jgi:hypothetical protein